MLHFGPHMGYTCEDGTTMINGIPTKKYQAHFSYPNIGAELEIVYHWSGNART